MSYKWKPSKQQRKNFAENMQNDSSFRKAYYERKEKRLQKRRSTSNFDYEKAGGEFVPTKQQHDAAFELSFRNPNQEQKEACDIVMFGFSNKEKVHHDYIHIINEYIREKEHKTIMGLDI